jgi:hypothetical protein
MARVPGQVALRLRGATAWPSTHRRGDLPAGGEMASAGAGKGQPRPGVTAGFAVSWAAWDTGWRSRGCGRSSPTPGSIPRPGGPARAGASSWRRRPRDPVGGLSSAWRGSSCAACRCWLASSTALAVSVWLDRRLAQHPPNARDVPAPPGQVRVLHRDRLGGLIHEYAQVVWRRHSFRHLHRERPDPAAEHANTDSAALPPG